MRALFLLAAVLPLSGCWLGDSLYGAGDARPAIAPGLYRTVDERGGIPPSTFRITTLPNGLTRAQLVPGNAGEEVTIGFAPLDGEGRAFVAWTVAGMLVERQGPVTYGLLRRGDDGGYVYIVPMCGRTLAIAAAAGAAPEGRDALACRFTSRASLEAALRSLPADADSLGDVVRLVPADRAGG